MNITIERTILDTKLNDLQVIKWVVETQLPLENSQEFCIRVSVAQEVLNDHQFISVKGYSTVAFFGENYERANEQYLEWLDTIVTDQDATYNKARGVHCLLDDLQGYY